MIIHFSVYGEPVPQGSKKIVPIYKKGSDGKPVPVMKDGRPLTRVASDNPKLGEWRQEIGQAAVRHYEGPLLTSPICLQLVFIRPRPANHFGTGRNAGKLKPSASKVPTTRPDTLKLARAVEDALTGVIWKDDSQIVWHDLSKQYGQRFEIQVTITTCFSSEPKTLF